MSCYQLLPPALKLVVFCLNKSKSGVKIQKIDLTNLKNSDQIIINNISVELNNLQDFYWHKKSKVIEFTTSSGINHEFYFS